MGWGGGQPRGASSLDYLQVPLDVGTGEGGAGLGPERPQVTPGGPPTTCAGVPHSGWGILQGTNDGYRPGVGQPQQLARIDGVRS